MKEPTKSAYIAFKEVFRYVIDENEDLQKRNLTPLHLIVFGLSTVSPRALLKYGMTDINATSSLDRTALC